MENEEVTCWVCGAPATTAEHKAKKSDLKAIFESVSQADPVFMHDGQRINIPVGGFDRKSMKWSKTLCENCNTTRTQPYDRAWDAISLWLRGRRFGPGSVLRATAINRGYGTRNLLLNMHLYFVKSLGCYLSDGGVPFEREAFRTALLTGRPHPGVHLKFGRGALLAGRPQVGLSDALWISERAGDASAAAAVFRTTVGPITVQIFYQQNDKVKFDGAKDAWHPRQKTSKIVVAYF